MPDITENTDKSTGNFIICDKCYCSITADRMGAVQETVKAQRNGFQSIINGMRKASRRK